LLWRRQSGLRAGVRVLGSDSEPFRIRARRSGPISLRIVPGLNRLGESGESQVVVVNNGGADVTRRWSEEARKEKRRVTMPFAVVKEGERSRSRSADCLQLVRSLS